MSLTAMIVESAQSRKIFNHRVCNRLHNFSLRSLFLSLTIYSRTFSSAIVRLSFFFQPRGTKASSLIDLRPHLRHTIVVYENATNYPRYPCAHPFPYIIIIIIYLIIIICVIHYCYELLIIYSSTALISFDLKQSRSIFSKNLLNLVKISIIGKCRAFLILISFQRFTISSGISFDNDSIFFMLKFLNSNCPFTSKFPKRCTISCLFFFSRIFVHKLLVLIISISIVFLSMCVCVCRYAYVVITRSVRCLFDFLFEFLYDSYYNY